MYGYGWPYDPTMASTVKILITCVVQETLISIYVNSKLLMMFLLTLDTFTLGQAKFL